MVEQDVRIRIKKWFWKGHRIKSPRTSSWNNWIKPKTSKNTNPSI